MAVFAVSALKAAATMLAAIFLNCQYKDDLVDRLSIDIKALIDVSKSYLGYKKGMNDDVTPCVEKLRLKYGDFSAFRLQYQGMTHFFTIFDIEGK